MPFITNTDEQRKEMLTESGLTMQGLFADIPEKLRCKPLNLPAGLTEQQLREHMAAMGAKNSANLACFLGGGFYDHFIPAAVDAITSRSEFYTAYTPYQPEISQGTLQAIYEYQSIICRLTEMQVANASLYDGGTAIYEAVTMAIQLTGRNKILYDDSVNPIYRVMLDSYTKNLHIAHTQIPNADGMTNHKQICEAIDVQTAAVVVQNPNFFGFADDFSDIAKATHEKGALLIVSCYPISLGILKTPGAMDADIVTGEGQCLGLPLSFGGPYLGIIATREKHMRKMPGRLVGQTTDNRGQRGFVLTLQTREQHIRREKATSNICSNESLCALRALVYLSLMGKEGLRQTAQLCADKATYAFKLLTSIKSVRPKFASKNFFNEFVLELPKPAEQVIAKLLEKGIAAGFPLNKYYKNMENSLLIAVTEKHTKQQIETLAEALEACL